MPFSRSVSVCCGGLFASTQQKAPESTGFSGEERQKAGRAAPFLFQMLRKTPAWAGSPADTPVGVAEE